MFRIIENPPNRGARIDDIDPHVICRTYLGDRQVLRNRPGIPSGLTPPS
jgi:hypothetical protein